ncbi:hypothetical protein U1Q18_033602 [Sarracenia purpurea var. burkii]
MKGRASLSTFPFLGKNSNGVCWGVKAWDPEGFEGRGNKAGKSIASSSRPPLESQTEYYYRCRGEASIAHYGKGKEGFIEPPKPSYAEEDYPNGGEGGKGYGNILWVLGLLLALSAGLGLALLQRLDNSSFAYAAWGSLE